MINLRNIKKTEPSDLEKEIARLFAELSAKQPHEDDYSATADQLVKLYKLKEVDSKKRVSADALVSLAGNLLGILLITQHEYTHALSSKALGFVGRKFTS